MDNEILHDLDILVVCSPERFMPQICLDTILRENLKIRLFFSNSIGTGAADARNYVKDMWQNNKDKSKYVLASDNDIIFPEGSIKAMVDFLDENEDFGAIALHRSENPTEVIEPSHINAGPVLYRSEIYKQITYHNEAGCECQGMSNDIRNLNCRIGYLNGYQYGHVHRTKRNDYGQ